jgi:hypothetical protein
VTYRTIRMAIIIAMMPLFTVPKLSAASAASSQGRAVAAGTDRDAHPALRRGGLGPDRIATSEPLLSPLIVALLGSISLGAAAIGCLALDGRNRRLANVASILLVLCGVLGLLALTLMTIQPSPA